MNAVTSIEQRQKIHYAEVRRRLFHTKPKPKPEPPAPVFVIPQWYLDQFDRTPRWKKGDLHFDAHVKAYQWQLAGAMGKRITAFIKERCQELGVAYEVIVGHGRSRRIVRIRHQIMYDLRFGLHLSLPEIGKALGGRDHTTILHGVRKIEASRALQPKEGE